MLLNCMLYSEDNLLWLNAEAEDAAVPDKDTDIKPHRCGAKSHRLERDDNPDEAPKSRVGMYGEETFNDDDDLGDDMSTEWNLRRCGALLDVPLGPLKDKLSSSNWLQRVSGILVLGAIAGGCISVIEPHLLTLVPYLIKFLNDSEACLFYLLICYHRQSIHSRQFAR